MKNLELIYVASPYSSTDKHIRSQRYTKVLNYISDLTKKGILAYSPILNFHNLNLPFYEFKYTKNFNYAMIDRSDILQVLKIDGWENSIGVKNEIEYATTKGKKIEYIPEKFFISDNTAEIVLSEICELLDVTREQVLTKNRLHKVCLARCVFSYLLLNKFGYCLTEIGKFLCLHHTTIINQIRIIENIKYNNNVTSDKIIKYLKLQGLNL